MFQHLGMAQEFCVLGRKMLHNLLNIMVSTHRCVELLVSLNFRFSSEHILADHNHWQKDKLQKRLRDKCDKQYQDRREQVKNSEQANKGQDREGIGCPHRPNAIREQYGHARIKALCRLLSCMQPV